MPRNDLIADCDRCAALCCIWLGFDASPAFAFTKPAGTACPHLRANRCGIHATLAKRGFAGCAAYDCHGAGQRATALFAMSGPLTDREKHDAFAMLREIHELLWLLDGAARFWVIDGALVHSLESIGRLSVEKLLAADLSPHRTAWRSIRDEMRRKGRKERNEEIYDRRMKCPGCTNDMVLVNIDTIEIDRCPSCGGIVLDKGESELIDSLGMAQVIEGGVTMAHQHRTTTARCYTCEKDMTALTGAGDVEYDWCDGCERLFFDRGELTAFDVFVND